MPVSLVTAIEKSRRAQGEVAIRLFFGERATQSQHLADRLFNVCPPQSRAAVVFGMWRGDEGKAKLVDLLTERADVVARYQGGANAGHSVEREDGSRVVFHQIPSGTRNPEITRLIGRGCFVEPGALVAERDALESAGVVLGTIRIDFRAAMTTVYGIISDRISNKDPRLVAQGKHRATGWAMADTAADKYLRKGIVIGDAMQMSWRHLVSALEEVRKRYRWIDEIPDETIIEVLRNTSYSLLEVRDTRVLAATYQRFFTDLYNKGVKTLDCAEFLRRALAQGKRALLEGAQASGLGIDTGPWPETTSSNGGCAGIWPGCGLDPALVPIRIGVMSAPYCTSVGQYSGPGEMDEETAKLIRAVWNESGATTGIPRRLFWPDVLQLQEAVQENRPTHLVLNRMDIAATAGVKKVRIITDYDGHIRSDPIEMTARKLAKAEPFFTILPCWSDIRGCRKKADLPVKTREYVQRFMQKLATDLPDDAILIGNGPKAGDLITE